MSFMRVAGDRTLLSLLRSRPRVRGAAAWFVVAALVVQAWLAAPLAMRMEASLQAVAGSGDAGLLLCAAGGSDSGSASYPTRGGSVPHHDHQHCILCQGGFAAAILAAVSGAQLPDALPAPLNPANSTLASAGGGAASYAPRAPPANDDA